MEQFICTRSDACQKYCGALLRQGVMVEISEDGCNVPDMFTIDETGFDFNPILEEETDEESPLIRNLVRSLAGVLKERGKDDPEQVEVEELITLHEDLFNARLNLWGAMLNSVKDGHKFTDVELRFYEDKVEEATLAKQAKSANIKLESRTRAEAAFDHKTLEEHKLLFDDQMIGAVNRIVSNLMDSKPTLVVGDKGIAKTQLLKFVTKLWDPTRTPLFISGHGDIMSDELIGGMKQDKKSGIFSFRNGMILKGMIEGQPIIYDEVNVGEQSIVMRLQELNLLKPGDHVRVQEDGEDEVIIQPGFVSFATANEASKRYKHRQVLDPAFRDRYDVLRIKYPDSGTKDPLQVMPVSLLRLAQAAAVDEHGYLSPHINPDTLEKFVRLAHVTQHLYSVPAKRAKLRISAGNGNVSTSGFLDEEPSMTDCISPRKLHDAIRRCKEGNKPDMTLENEMETEIQALDQAGSNNNEIQAREALKLLRGK